MTTDKAPELLPCPFCGDKMSYFGDHEIILHEDEDAEKCPLADRAFLSLAAWNTRADLAAPSPDVLALVGAATSALDDMDEWLAISESLIRAGFNMDDTQARADNLRAALARITDKGGRKDAKS